MYKPIYDKVRIMMTQKIISVVLALLLLFGGVFALFSCEKEEPDEFESETESNVERDTESTQTNNGKEPLKIVENGKSEYVVVYPTDASQNLLSVVDLLIARIEAQTGVRLKSKSDHLRGKDEHDPNEKAILIGRTNYDESQAVLDSLGRFEYKIAQVGNKMVVMALDENLLKTAIDHYISRLLKPNVEGEEGSKTLLLEEYHYIPEKASTNTVIINGVDIESFSIVYKNGDSAYRELAEKLQSSILTFIGVELPVYSDSKAETENEILVGKTSRAFSQSLYGNLERYVMTYSLEVSGSKMQILSGGYFSAYQCIADMCFYVLNNGVVEYVDGTYMKTQVLSSPSELTSGADIRIMNSNLLNSDWAEDKLDVIYRAEMFAGALLDYRPDAVGLQEMDRGWEVELEKWIDVLRNEYGLEYSLHHAKNPNGGTNFITVLYRSDVYNCVEEDTHMYPHWDKNYSQGISITMCKLRSKVDSSKEFILMNTHWDVDLWDGAQKDICSTEAAAFLNSKKSEGCPIFMTGDWNANRGRECLENFITATGTQTADEGKYCIEFTFYCGDSVRALKNECVTRYSQMSDHPFRYTDFNIW